jgi:hypothetical protein
VLNAVILIGPIVLLAALVLAVAYPVRVNLGRNHGPRIHLGRYTLGVGVVGAVAFVAGAALGIAVFCAPDDAANLCGLGGVFGLGPLLAGVGIVISAHCRIRGARNAT